MLVLLNKESLITGAILLSLKSNSITINKCSFYLLEYHTIFPDGKYIYTSCSTGEEFDVLGQLSSNTFFALATHAYSTQSEPTLLV